MDHAAATEASKIVLAEGRLSLGLRSMSFPTQNGIYRPELLNVARVFINDNLGLAKTSGFEVLFVVDYLFGHLLRQDRVILVEHAKGSLMLVFWLGHNGMRELRKTARLRTDGLSASGK
jgi:hypothetical protein